MGKRKKRIYNDIIIVFLIASLFTLLFFVSCIIAGIASTDELSRMVDIPDTLEILSGFGVICLPTLIIISWHMCIERHLVLELKKEKWNNEQDRNKYKKNITYVVWRGVIVYFCVLEIFLYGILNWKLVDGVLGCFLIKIVIIICWLTGWIKGIKERKKIDNYSKKNRVVMFVLMVGITVVAELYTYNKADDVWYEKMVEYYEQHQGDEEVLPYS